ncbi:hypothetical protein KR018_001436 [Drosophila ironensis]|nr:hypothetical protein KR018_001436 [Drosophila ironensis]
MLLQLSEKINQLDQHLEECWNLKNNLSNFDFFSFLSVISLSATKMAAIPQGAFAACKLRERFNEREMIVARLRSAAGADKASIDNPLNRKFCPPHRSMSNDSFVTAMPFPERENSPNKYNDKLMNSIWGLYNRYSPHNVKKNEYAPTK